MRQSRGQQQQNQGREPRRRVPPRRERSFQWLVWTLVGLVGAASLVLVILLAGGILTPEPKPTPPAQTSALTAQQMAQLASTGQSMGSPSAKVTILEFSDFQ